MKTHIETLPPHKYLQKLKIMPKKTIEKLKIEFKELPENKL